MSIYRTAVLSLLLPALAIPGLRAKDQSSVPVAEVGGTKITESQMKQEIGTDIYEAELNLYQLKKDWIDQKARSLLFESEAKKVGLSLADWQRNEIDKKIGPPSDAEVKSVAQQIARQQKTGGQPDAAKLAEFEAQAREMLTRQRISQRTNVLYQELLKKQPIKILMKKPEIPKINVAFSRQDPSSGPEKAPITIVAFTDFQCSYCRRGHETMKEIEALYPGKIHMVQRQFPLSFHKRARAAAEAALCAGDQNQFWTYADKLFANQQKLEDADLQKYAEELKLNSGEFGQCVSSHKYGAQIDRDVADGERYGVRGTPAYFVNGRFLSGAQPLENFQEVIDAELARKK
jgi:protein-disulfide isomerase